MATSKIKPSVRKIEMTLVNATNVDAGWLRLFKNPNTQTVRAYGFFRKSSNITTNTVIFTVPEGYRPKGNYAIPMYLKTDSTTAAFYGVLTPSGEITQSVGSATREGLVVGEWDY